MQNKPNFDKGQNKPNPLYKKDLRKFYTPSDNEKRTQNKPNTNPIKANKTLNKPNFKPKQTQSNPISISSLLPKGRDKARLLARGTFSANIEHSARV